MINKDFQPILIVPAIPKNDGIVFFLPSESVEIENDMASIVWEILSYCNGYNDINYIMSNMDCSNEIIKGIIEDLSDLKIICDSRKQYQNFHNISMSPDLYYRNLSREDIILHVNSARKYVKNGEKISFNIDSNSSLSKLINARRSCRSFLDHKLSKDIVGNICFNAYSIHHHSVPSGGALYPLKLFVLVDKDQKDLSSGYYEYDSENEILVKLEKQIDIETLKYCFNDETMPFGSAIQIVIAADLERQTYKYSNRGYRLTLIEVGQVAQNISLYCQEIGLATCELGGALDEALTRELELDKDKIYPILSIAIGKSSTLKRFDYVDFKYNLEEELLGENKPIRSVRSYYFGDKVSWFGAYSVYGEDPNEISGATSSSYAMAQSKAIIEGFERFQSKRRKVDYIGSAKSIKNKWLHPYDIRPLTREQCEYEGLSLFSKDLKIEWVKGKYLFNQKEVLVPADLVFYGDKGVNNRICFGDSSGVAAHTDYMSAVEGALLELIERDAIMRNWYERKPPKKLSEDILPTHLVNRIRHWRKKGRQVYVLDMNSNYAPTFQVIIVSNEYPYFVSGAASSVGNIEDALIKALNEAEFSLLLYLNHSDSRKVEPKDVCTPEDHGKLYAQSADYLNNISWLWELNETEYEIPKPRSSFDNLIRVLNPIVVDISDDKYSIKVVRVISDKCLPISFGYNMDYYTHSIVSEINYDNESRMNPHYFA